LLEGLVASGCEITDIGVVPTPLLYYSAVHLEADGAVMITGSHNPSEFNGFKTVRGSGTIHGEEIQEVRRLIEARDFLSGHGSHRMVDVISPYLGEVAGQFKFERRIKVVADAGNGTAGPVMHQLFKRLNCEVTELFFDMDGRFPNHHPDPSQLENLQDLIATVRQKRAEIGLAFDGDGDRLGVVTAEGSIIFPDRQLILFAKDVLSRQPGAEIIYDVKSTRNLAPWIRKYGGVPSLWKTGHSLIKARLKERGAALAGEMSGHVFFVERWYGFDDAQYAGARLLEILSKTADATATLNALPDSVSTPELHLPLSEGEPHRLIGMLQKNTAFPGSSEVIRLDGLRVEYPFGFGLARASNTTPVIVLRFEADDEPGLVRIKSEFRRVLLSVKPDAKLPF